MFQFFYPNNAKRHIHTSFETGDSTHSRNAVLKKILHGLKRQDIGYGCYSSSSLIHLSKPGFLIFVTTIIRRSKVVYGMRQKPSIHEHSHAPGG